MEKAIFLSLMIVLILFNGFYVAVNPSDTWNMGIGVLTGFIATIIGIALVSGIQIAGSGLSGETLALTFGVGSLLNVLFQVNIAGFPIGLGLINRLYQVFSLTDFWGIGFFLTTTIAICLIITGLIIIIGG